MAAPRVVLAALTIAATIWAAPSAAGPADRLAEVLQVEEVVALIRDEGIVEGVELGQEMLGGSSPDHWQKEVARIHDPRRMFKGLVDAIETKMSEESIVASTRFFETVQGQRIVTLEVSARRAMTEPSVEEAAREAYNEIAGQENPHLSAVERFIAVNELTERNVHGAMRANLQFYRGLVDGGGLQMDDDLIVQDIYERGDEIRDDTEEWLHSYLLMAYRPLDRATMESYIAFSGTEAGQALNVALFNGFDAVYGQISYELGLGIGRAMQAEEL